MCTFFVIHFAVVRMRLPSVLLWSLKPCSPAAPLFYPFSKVKRRTFPASETQRFTCSIIHHRLALFACGLWWYAWNRTRLVDITVLTAIPIEIVAFLIYVKCLAALWGTLLANIEEILAVYNSMHGMYIEFEFLKGGWKLTCKTISCFIGDYSRSCR